jgi:hypothetical protein
VHLQREMLARAASMLTLLRSAMADAGYCACSNRDSGGLGVGLFWLDGCRYE